MTDCYSAKKQHNSCRSSLERTRSLRVQIWFLYWLDILPWMFQRHLRISMCETELMIFSENRSSFSVSYLSQWHEHPPSSAAQKPRRHALHLHLLNLAISSITWFCRFRLCNSSNLPVYLYLCCLPLVLDVIVCRLDSWFFTGLGVISQCAHYGRVTYSKYKSNQISSLRKAL